MLRSRRSLVRRIAIVGGGQAGLPLAFGLLDRGYEVTVVSNRTPAEIRAGRVMSTQMMFGSALRVERDLGINYWESACPHVEGVRFAITQTEPAAGKLVDWKTRLQRPGQSVDQRVKMAGWLERLEGRGGRLLLQDVGLPELEVLAATHDLVIVAAGKGDVVRLFERDASRSPFDQPQRALVLTYVHGLEKSGDYPCLGVNLIPGAGEYFVMPALTLSGACDIMFFEVVPGGPLDCWDNAHTPQEQLARTMRLLREYLPEEAERARQAELTDENGFLSGRFAPTVRKPVLTLPSGRLVFALGDAAVLTDPITGQGSSNAAKASQVYLEAILERGALPYTRAWMEQTFERFWSYARWVVQWTNSLLLPPEPHILELFGAAAHLPSLASVIANGFDHPPSLFPWWADQRTCTGFIAEHQLAASTV
jgi:2-polyprenyl-6-methoxyphenol hydroxylase-like FAD-dependent oxidoreductase